MALIELKNISKTYHIGGEIPVYALKDVSLKVESGEFVAIMGASGSGKSTLLAILGLLDKSDSGDYFLADKNISRLNDDQYAHLRNQFFGFIFQMFNLLPRMNVIDNVMLPFIYAGTANLDNRSRILGILEKIGLGDRLKHRPNQLSGGQQQRGAIARAIANKPLVILADEPTGNLDSKSAAEIIELLHELNRQGNTIIMVTHEQELAQAATRILTLRDGEIISDKKNHDHKTVAVPTITFNNQRRHKVLSLAGIKNYSFEALASLYTNKLRSFLSILGVMIGVAAVVAMLSMGTGAQKQVEQTMAGLGTNLLMVSSSFRSQGISMGTGSPTRFTVDDLKALEKIEGVARVAPNVSGRVQSVYQNQNWNTSVVGSNPSFQQVRNSYPESGRFFTLIELNSKAKVAVLGKTVAMELFGEADPLGKQIRLNRIAFTVIGVLAEKGSTGFNNQDDQVLIPYTTAMYRLLGKDYINSFMVQASDAELIPAIQEEINTQILKLHRMTESQTEKIEIRNMAEMQQAATEMIKTFAYLLGSIAAVSLLVGGIGIMNIMLVLVMERTHEIGLRKALGAENKDIMMQFVVESMLICILGGALGSALGILISWLISTFAGWAVYISAWSVILAFGFSALIGLVFGLWPAWRAAKLLPIVALRYE